MENAYLLHSKKYRESSLLVYFLTKEFGKVSCVAKGARRQRSHWVGVLQPFSELKIDWVGKGELHTLTKAEIDKVGPLFTGNSIFFGYYVNELLIKALAAEDPHPDLFDKYVDYLNSVKSMKSRELEFATRLFEKSLLEELGYNFSFINDVNGIEIEEARDYVFIPEQGLILSENQGNNTYKGKDILKFASNILDEENITTIKRLMRNILVSIVGRDFDTRKVYSEIMGFAK